MKTKNKMVLFDLDGTLTDSGPGVTECVRRTLEHLKKPIPPYETLRKFIGPPLWDSFTVLCGMNPRETQQGIGYFHDIYREIGVYNNAVYPGIPDVLDDLRKAGTIVAVATSKPESMTKIVLDHFGLSPYFDIVAAADESDKGGGKEALIRSALKKARCDPKEATMIGDTKFDAAGAREAGTDFVGVLYGFGTEDEMRREGGGKFARNPADLKGLLIDKT